jgi:hypothetical protein
MNKSEKLTLERTFRSARPQLGFNQLVVASVPFFESVDSPRSLGCYLRLKYEAYAEYLNVDFRPEEYTSPLSFFKDYECAKLFSKAEFMPSGINTRKAAEASFIQAEIQCYETNKKFEDRVAVYKDQPVMAALTARATRKIARILGPCPSIDELDIRFGPGQNVGLTDNNTSVVSKLGSPLTFTENLRELVPEVLDSCPSWAQLHSTECIPTPNASIYCQAEIVGGSTLGFVPKNAKTERAICVEPLMNSSVQMGIGKHMRKRLRSAGCNLNSQERNQRLAKKGSITDTLSTIDLKAASDTISYSTVLELLPLPWFELLSKCRCESYSYENKDYSFEKFSSMGNGFTFELESLLFYALSLSVCEFLKLDIDDVSVYGDDIIVPQAAFGTLEDILTFFGFSLNREKSFHRGPFRESCGSDWYLGKLVRPLFIKRRPTNATLMGWCNHLWRMSEGLQSPRHKALYLSLKKLVDPVFLKLRGPDGYGDGHFVCVATHVDIQAPHAKKKRGWEGVSFYTLEQRAIKKALDHDSVYSAALYHAQNCKALTSPQRMHSLAIEAQRVVMHLSSKSDESSRQINGFYGNIRRQNTRTVLTRSFAPW